MHCWCSIRRDRAANAHDLVSFAHNTSLLCRYFDVAGVSVVRPAQKPLLLPITTKVHDHNANGPQSSRSPLPFSCTIDHISDPSIASHAPDRVAAKVWGP